MIPILQHAPKGPPPKRSVYINISGSVFDALSKYPHVKVDWTNVFNRAISYTPMIWLHYATFHYDQLGRYVTQVNVVWNCPVDGPIEGHGVCPNNAFLKQSDDTIKYVAYVWIKNIVQDFPVYAETMIADAIAHEGVGHWFCGENHIDSKVYPVPPKFDSWLMAPKLKPGRQLMDNITLRSLAGRVGLAQGFSL